jgi:O-antigen/teichoic acid export membrane protein
VRPATRPSPGIEATPPVTPTEVPGERQVGRNTVETLLFRALSTPIALVLVLIQSRFLGPSGRGTFVLAVLSVTILSRLLGQLGLAVTARMRERDLELRRLVHRALGLAVVLGGVGAGLATGVAVATGVETEIAVIAALALVPNVVWQIASGVLLGLARVRAWNYVQALSPLLTLVGMLILVVALDGGVAAALLAWTLAHVLTAALALVIARDTWLPVGPTPILDRHGRTILALALAMGAVQVVNLIGYRIELFVLELFEGVDAVGIYSIAMQAAEAMWLVAGAIATAVTAPAVHETEERARELISRSARRALLLTGAVAVVVGLAAPFLVPLLFGEDFSDSVRPLWVLLPGVVAYAPVTVLVVYLSVRRGRPRFSLAVSVMALIVTAAAALVLIPAWGTTGAAGASTLGYVAGGVLAWVFFLRLGREQGLGTPSGQWEKHEEHTEQ